MTVRRFPVCRAFASFNLIASCLVSITGVKCLQITDFHVPKAATVGEDKQLSCRYQLNNNETLYFLRWHKDGNEFFRYMPKETPPDRIYNVSGLRVKPVFLNSTNVMLTKVDVSTSGTYRCEISGDSPGFETADREAEFIVVEPPQGRPTITVSHKTFEEKVYDTIVANCSGPENREAPQHNWTLASIPIPTEKFTQWVHNGFYIDKLKKTTSTLHLETEWIEDVLIPRLRKSGHLNDLIRGSYIVLSLRCTSDIHGLFQDSDSVDIMVLRNIPASTSVRPFIPGSRDIIKSSKSSLTSTYGVNTRHGAFTNVASSVYSHFLNRLSFLVMSSSWLVHHWRVF